MEEYEWVKGPGGRDDPRSMALIRAGDITVDQRVQRAVAQQKIDRLATEWDWDLAEVLTLSRRPDGTLVATEGQHRLLALHQRDPDIHIWCILPDDVEGTAEEAAVALGITRGRRPHNKLQQWKMELAAGDPHVVLAEKVLDELGLSVTDSKSKNSVQAAGLLMRIVHGTAAHPLSPQNGSQQLRIIMQVIAGIPDASLTGRRYSGAILQAVAEVVSRWPELNIVRLHEKLSARTADQWIAFGRTSMPQWRGIQDMIVTDYNHSLRDKRLK